MGKDLLLAFAVACFHQPRTEKRVILSAADHSFIVICEVEGPRETQTNPNRPDLPPLPRLCTLQLFLHVSGSIQKPQAPT
jgi:hypothetical protein